MNKRNTRPKFSESDNSALPWTTQLNDHRRRLILEAAESEFVRNGLERTTTRGIAKRAGCTTGAIYALFIGKNELYAAVLQTSLDRLQLAMHTARQVHAAREQPEAVMRALFDYYSARPAEVSLGLYLFGTDGPKGLGKRIDKQLNETLRRALSEMDLAFSACTGIALATAAEYRNYAFSNLIGVLVLQQAGRTKMMGTSAESLLAKSIETIGVMLRKAREHCRRVT